MPPTFYSAAYLIDGDFHAIPQGMLVVENGRIIDIGPRQKIGVPAGATVRDFGNAVISPGFINAHCHLELTHLANQFARPDTFQEWLFQVRERRNSSTPEVLDRSIREGLRQSVEGGVTTIADLRNWSTDYRQFIEHPMRKVFFPEVIGFPETAAETALQATIDRLASIPADPLLTVGIAPHSPYAVSPKLYQMLHELSEQRNIVMHTHLWEHSGELEFVQSGTGAFKDLLERFGRMDPNWHGTGDMSPIRYLDRLGCLNNIMAIHLNYHRQEDVDLLAERGVHVTYCPRSSHYFGHQNYPLELYLKAGLPISIGTDSLASNYTLSLLDDIKFMHEHYPQIPPRELLRMHTEHGARALRLEAVTGALRKGLEADFAVIRYGKDSGDAFRNMVAADAAVIATVVAGKTLFAAPELSGAH